MHIRPGYMIRKVVDVHVIIGIGGEAYTPNEIMSLNETGAFLWRILEKGAERGELIDALTGEYDVDARRAAADVDAFLATLRAKALIDG
ncbi:MAG: PqqD family protein [Clostridia bacterium]|nr:PqqD family protein [Clostridia bacterium]